MDYNTINTNADARYGGLFHLLERLQTPDVRVSAHVAVYVEGAESPRVEARVVLTAQPDALVDMLYLSRVYGPSFLFCAYHEYADMTRELEAGVEVGDLVRLSKYHPDLAPAVQVHLCADYSTTRDAHHVADRLYRELLGQFPEGKC